MIRSSLSKRRSGRVLAAAGAVVAAALVLAGCSSSSPSSSSSSASSSDGAFPVSITTGLGTTTIDSAPKRVVALGWGDAETALELGVQPVGASDWLAFGGDGVGPWLAFRAITLPHLVPMMLLAVTFRLLDAIRLFDTIFMMTGGGPGTQTYTASFYLYTVGFTQFHLSQATAGSWIFLVVTLLVVSLLVRRLLRTDPV